MIEVELTMGPAEGQRTQTPGGARLRAVREQLRKTQLQVELDADLGTGYLQRLESGRVQQPVRVTLERILEALGARFSERREILELFGYMVRVPLPTVEERNWAASIARPEIDPFPFPAYLLDCSHQLVLWNRIFPSLFGGRGESIVRNQLTGRSFLATWFDPGSPMAALIADPDQTFPALLRAFRHEMRQFQYSGYYDDLLAELMSFERFRHYWELAEVDQSPASATRALVPIRLRLADGQELLFRLSAEQFTRDTRFRIIYYFPSDAVTMAICECWGESLSDQAIGPT